MADAQRIERALPFAGGVISDSSVTARQWEDMENLLPRMGGGSGLKPRGGILWIQQLTTSVAEGCVVFLVKLDNVTDRSLVVLMNASTGQILILGEQAEQFGRKAQDPWSGGLDPDDPNGGDNGVAENALPFGYCEPFVRFAPEVPPLHGLGGSGVPILVPRGGIFYLPIYFYGDPGDAGTVDYFILNSSGALATSEVDLPTGTVSLVWNPSIQFGGMNGALDPHYITINPDAVRQELTVYLSNPFYADDTATLQMDAPTRMVVQIV